MILWVGHEKEGDYLGVYTLFIGSDTVTVDRIGEVLNQHPDVKQLYFGAGICTNINKSVVELCIKRFINLDIMLEIELSKFDPSYQQFYNKVRFILTINDNNLLKVKQVQRDNIMNIQLKLQSVDYHDKIVMLQNVNNFKHTNMDDFKEKTYKTDVIIE